MPQYAFSCSACGPFEVWRPVAEAGAPLACPACAGEATRLFTAPGVARMAPAMRGARDREERSRHAPDVVAAKTGRPMPGHGHGAPWAHSH